jgi:hypothetical protein
MGERLDPRVQSVVDKQEIRDALMRYCRGIDRRDPDLIVSAFHEDAVDDHGDMKGSPAQLAGFVAKGTQPQLMHFVGNHLAEVDGHKAFSESYFISFMTVTADGKDYTRTRAGRYLDNWERRKGAWKIAHRVVVDEWSRLDEVVATVDGIGFYRGTRSKDDLLYKLQATVG